MNIQRQSLTNITKEYGWKCERWSKWDANVVSRGALTSITKKSTQKCKRWLKWDANVGSRRFGRLMNYVTTVSRIYFLWHVSLQCTSTVLRLVFASRNYLFYPRVCTRVVRRKILIHMVGSRLNVSNFKVFSASGTRRRSIFARYSLRFLAAQRRCWMVLPEGK